MPSRVRADLDDPLTRAVAPPPDETPAAREERLQAEARAKKISMTIDEEINKERPDKKAPRPVKILLLGTYSLLVGFPGRKVDLFFLSGFAGQSESGTSMSPLTGTRFFFLSPIS